LVVIIIIGILSAIALPAFLNQANKKAKQYIASINKGQQAYYAEMGVKGDMAKFCSTTGICAVPDSAIALGG
jgi:type II secretory pathway pseudopilin PulG